MLIWTPTGNLSDYENDVRFDILQHINKISQYLTEEVTEKVLHGNISIVILIGIVKQDTSSPVNVCDGDN